MASARELRDAVDAGLLEAGDYDLGDATLRAKVLMVTGRLIMLSFIAVGGLAATRSVWVLGWTALLALAAVPALTAPWRPVLGRAGRAAEVVVAVVAALALVPVGPALPPHGGGWLVLPYLLAPVVGAGLYKGRPEATALVVMSGLALAAGGLVTGRLTDSTYLLPASAGLVLAAVGAAFSGALYRLLRTPRRPHSWPEATRLLTQLRTVARHLPGGTLDPGGIAAHLLDEVRALAPVDRAAVLGASGGGRLVVLAQTGADRVDWETSLDADSAVADAWASQQSQVTSRPVSRTRAAGGTGISALVVPLVSGVRTIGLLAAEADAVGAYPPRLSHRVTEIAGPAALRLEAALLFDEIRTLATTEERQRLAREIHDGVAQELVMVGYGIDNALAQLPADSAAAADLQALRGEVTRVITELRLSLFELRSEVDRHGGLAAAIADYARTIGASAGFRVHLSLDESTARLPAAVEGELLRIAQEAITNARKHARAENLWVMCEVDPPYARIEVSDDGQGIAAGSGDGRYGMKIMKERASRIRGHLDVRTRDPRGTTVAMVLGKAARRGSVSAPEGGDHRE